MHFLTCPTYEITPIHLSFVLWYYLYHDITYNKSDWLTYWLQKFPSLVKQDTAMETSIQPSTTWHHSDKPNLFMGYALLNVKY